MARGWCKVSLAGSGSIASGATGISSTGTSAELVLWIVLNQLSWLFCFVLFCFVFPLQFSSSKQVGYYRKVYEYFSNMFCFVLFVNCHSTLPSA